MLGGSGKENVSVFGRIARTVIFAVWVSIGLTD